METMERLKDVLRGKADVDISFVQGLILGKADTVDYIKDAIKYMRKPGVYVTKALYAANIQCERTARNYNILKAIADEIKNATSPQSAVSNPERRQTKRKRGGKLGRAVRRLRDLGGLLRM
jgi:hypothetical protein